MDRLLHIVSSWRAKCVLWARTTGSYTGARGQVHTTTKRSLKSQGTLIMACEGSGRRCDCVEHEESRAPPAQLGKRVLHLAKGLLNVAPFA